MEEWVDGRMEGWKNGRMDDKAQNMVLYRTGHPLVKASIAAIDLEMRSLAAAEPDEDLNPSIHPFFLKFVSDPLEIRIAFSHIPE
jgi:hypothetical protein